MGYSRAVVCGIASSYFPFLQCVLTRDFLEGTKGDVYFPPPRWIIASDKNWSIQYASQHN
jgi:hypothetical protein